MKKGYTYKWGVCKKAFKSKTDIIKHLKTAHGAKTTPGDEQKATIPLVGGVVIAIGSSLMNQAHGRHNGGDPLDPPNDATAESNLSSSDIKPDIPF